MDEQACCRADEVSRENYEKYGHPDGPQSLNMGVALPEWIFAADSKAAPLLLIGLVSLCILLPLVLMACFLANSNKYMGSGGVMAETLDIFVRWGAPALQGITFLPRRSNSACCCWQCMSVGAGAHTSLFFQISHCFWRCLHGKGCWLLCLLQPCLAQVKDR